MRVCECARQRGGRSVARLRLCHKTFYLVEIDAHDSADEAAVAVVNVHLRNRVNIELLRDCSSPIHDVDLAQRDLGIISHHLLQARRKPSTRAAPVCVELDNIHIPEREMLVNVHLRAVRNHLD